MTVVTCYMNTVFQNRYVLSNGASVQHDRIRGFLQWKYRGVKVSTARASSVRPGDGPAHWLHRRARRPYSSGGRGSRAVAATAAVSARTRNDAALLGATRLGERST